MGVEDYKVTLAPVDLSPITSALEEIKSIVDLVKNDIGKVKADLAIVKENTDKEIVP